MSRRVIRGKKAGFCMGVALALKKLDMAIARYPSRSIFTLGPIIHNPQVIARYRKRGVVPLERLEDLKEDAVVIIRAHGIPKEDALRLKRIGVIVIDATCPRVKRAQELIARESGKGRILLLFGEAHHPEVKGLLSHAGGDAIVFGTLEEIRSMPLPKGEVFLAAQTTQDREVFSEVKRYLEDVYGESLVVLDTICDATRQRQQEAVELAKKSDFVVVIGGHNSGNTRRLAQVVRSIGTPCVHIETVKDIPLEQAKSASTIAITAGASTPQDLISQVEDFLKQLS